MLRGDIRYRLTAAATSTLLLVDAWFDIVTSAPGAHQLAAVVMAAALELPIALLCAILAARGQRASSAAPLPEMS
jgi:UDP-N-acetylmuramyl pentapeptide synthase